MIPIAKPFLGEKEAAAARRVILSGWTPQGPEVAAFEREFAECVGVPHACAVSSCTTALHLALLAGVRGVCYRQRILWDGKWDGSEGDGACNQKLVSAPVS